MDRHDRIPTAIAISAIIAVTIFRLAALLAVIWLASKVIMAVWR